MRRTFDANRSAFWLVAELQTNYRAWLWEHGLQSGAEIRAQFDGIRLRLLSAILETTPGGYRAADARFLAGEIFFSHGNLAEAARWWRDIRPDAGDSYLSAYSCVIDQLRAAGDLRAADIKRVLDVDRGRWWEFSYQRLRKFGHACDTF